MQWDQVGFWFSLRFCHVLLQYRAHNQQGERGRGAEHGREPPEEASERLPKRSRETTKRQSRGSWKALAERLEGGEARQGGQPTFRHHDISPLLEVRNFSNFATFSAIFATRMKRFLIQMSGCDGGGKVRNFFSPLLGLRHLFISQCIFASCVRKHVSYNAFAPSRAPNAPS